MTTVSSTKGPLGGAALGVLFRDARTHNRWLDQPVSDGILRALYELVKMGPTSVNGCPARILFLRTAAAKERLRPALAPPNVEKTIAAPVTAIVAYDTEFYVRLSKLMPHKDMYPVFAGNRKLAEITAFRNGSIQGGYFILAARSLGLDCGPLSGFDNDKVDEEFFASPRAGARFGGKVKSNFLCNLGYGDPTAVSPRNPRLNFEEACESL